MSLDGPFPVNTAEVAPFAAPHVEHSGAGVGLLDQGPQKRRAVARIQEPPPGLDGLSGIARVLRAPILWLEQVAIAAAGEVEGVPSRTDQGSVPALQGGGAVADGADQGGQEWLRRRSKSILTDEKIVSSLWSMATRTVELDEEAYEILSQRKREDQSFSEIIKEHFGKPGSGTAGDLLRMADRYVLSEETLDAIENHGKICTARDLLEYVKNMEISEETLDVLEEVVQTRRQSPARIVDFD